MVYVKQLQSFQFIFLHMDFHTTELIATILAGELRSNENTYGKSRQNII